MCFLQYFRFSIKGRIQDSPWGRACHQHTILSIFPKQECILVRCVPSAAVAVWGGGSVPRGSLSGGGLPKKDVYLPPVDRMTDTCENITYYCGR